MNIIFGDENINQLEEKYIVLELDTFRVQDKLTPTYCVIDSANIGNIKTVESNTDLHRNLIKNYKKGDFNFCNQAIGHLRGKFNGELDTFYDEVAKRISSFPSDEEWDSVITR